MSGAACVSGAPGRFYRKSSGGKKISADLEVGHDSELINLFGAQFLEELFRCVLDVLARGDGAADDQNVGARLERVLHDMLPDAARGRDQEPLAARLLDRRDVSPGVGGIL